MESVAEVEDKEEGGLGTVIPSLRDQFSADVSALEEVLPNCDYVSQASKRSF